MKHDPDNPTDAERFGASFGGFAWGVILFWTALGCWLVLK